MKYPEGLYQLADFDIQKASWAPQRVAAQANTSSAAVQVSVAFGPVPSDRALIVTSCALELRSGAGQTVDRALIRVVDEGGTTEVAPVAVRRPGTQFSDLNWSGEIIVMPGEFLRGLGDFSAGANANSVFFGFMGVLIARANLQRGSIVAA